MRLMPLSPMKLPDDARRFRDLSLLHDTALRPEQREKLLDATEPSIVFMHQMYVRKLLGCFYVMPQAPRNRAKSALSRWLSA